MHLNDGCRKNGEEMSSLERMGLAAFKTKILIKNKTEIWLCTVSDCQKYSLYEAGAFM